MSELDQQDLIDQLKDMDQIITMNERVNQLQ